MDTQKYIIEKYKIDLAQKSPFHIKCCRVADLPGLFKELGFKRGAEIGVLKGEYSEKLCQSNPDLKIYSIDAWEFYPLKNNFRRDYMYPPIYEEAKNRLAKYPNNEVIRKWSQDAVNDFEDESFDFVFIDADHEFQHVTNDIAEWQKKVRKGGIICGHDYGRSRNRKETFCHVKDVVNAWAYSHDIHPWYVLESPNKFETGWLWVKE